VRSCQVLFIALIADVRYHLVEGLSTLMMKFLTGLVRGLHMTIGIHTPPPEQEALYVFVWIGIILFMIGGFALMFYLLG
jgi:hypothetical protein